jgi:hypothetical protein
MLVSDKTDKPHLAEPTQRTLFDTLPEAKSSRPALASVVDNPTREHLLVSLMALASLKGIGFRTLCSMFDAGFLHNVWEWGLEEIAHKSFSRD